MDNGHERRRAVQLIILVSYTIISCVLLGETLLLGWDKGAAVLLLLGGVACWFLHITRRISREQRLWLCVILTMLAFLFYGAHETSLYDLAPVMIGAMILFSATEVYPIILLCVGVYYLTVAYALVFVIGKSMEYTPLVVTRLLLHFLMVTMVAYLLKVNMKRRADEIQEMENRIICLEEVNRRTENFLTNVSHELRTPINAVTGITAVMLKNESDSEMRKDIVAVQEAGQRLFGQIEDILDYTEIDTGRICVVEDSYMISSIVNDLVMGGQFMQREHGPELILDVDAKLPAMLSGDGRKIKKILKHLIGNALKFTKTGGVYVYIYGLKKDYGINLCIRVSDTGEGIEPEKLDRITERFFQSSEGENRKAGGLGLGLSIVHGMVSAMEGFMQIRSQVGKGTTVDVSIPQKVVDETPGMVVDDKEKICAACYLRPERYKIPELRNYYNESISHLAAGLDLTVHRVFDLEELKKLSAIYQLTHLLIGRDEYEEEPGYFEQLAQRIQVVVVADGSFTPAAGSRIILLKKPFYSLPIVNILNTKERAQAQLWEHMNMICPDVRVLVVDDEPMNLMVAQGILGDYRMTVKTAQSGAEAIEICEKEDFDLLFLDHMMPQMDGVETLRHIRKLMEDTNRDITAIAFTANAVSGAREMFYKEGFDEFISKPIETMELERVLRKVLPRTKLAYVSELELNRTKLAKEQENECLHEPDGGETSSDWLGALREKGIHTDSGLQYSREDVDFYRQIVEKFAGDYEKNTQKLAEFYARKDTENYRISVHALKSTSKMIGADDFSAQAKAAEDAAKNEDFAYLDAHHEELLAAYGSLVHTLCEVLSPEDGQSSGDSLPPDGEAEDSSASVSREELCEKLSELTDCLKTFEVDRAETILSGLTGVICDGINISKQLGEIRSDIDDFEMASAEKKVQALMEQLQGRAQNGDGMGEDQGSVDNQQADVSEGKGGEA